jgi:multicomponent Na+:H+ antiporter subunit D
VAERPRGEWSARLAMLTPVVALGAITITIGLAAEPFVDYSLRAAHQLLDPAAYIAAVLGDAPLSSDSAPASALP